MPHRADPSPYSRLTTAWRPLDLHKGGGGPGPWGCPHRGCGKESNTLEKAWLHLEDVHRMATCEECSAVMKAGSLFKHKRNYCSVRKAKNLTVPRKRVKLTKVHECG